MRPGGATSVAAGLMMSGAGVVWGLCAWGCSAGSSGTTGQTLALPTVVTVQAGPTPPPANAFGWSVTLSRAYLSVGTLYYFAGEPVLSERVPRATRAPRSVWATLQNLAEGTAFAHPGHYMPGDALGQTSNPTTFDLFAGPTSLGTGVGVTGTAHSARFTWQSPAVGEMATQLGADVVWTAGLASRGDTHLHFVARASAQDVADPQGAAQVDGCRLGAAPGQVGVELSRDGVMTLTVVPAVWFDEVDFAYAIHGGSAQADDAGREDAADASASDVATSGTYGGVDRPIDITPTLAWRGFVRGLKKGTGYLFSFGK